MWINYYGPPGTFPQISFSDIISGRYKEGFFAKKIVLVGVTAIGIESEVSHAVQPDREGHEPV